MDCAGVVLFSRRKDAGMRRVSLAGVIAVLLSLLCQASDTATGLSAADRLAAGGKHAAAVRLYREFVEKTGYGRETERALIALAGAAHAAGDLPAFLYARDLYARWFPEGKAPRREFDEYEASLRMRAGDWSGAAALVETILGKYQYPPEVADRWRGFLVVCYTRLARPDRVLEIRLEIVRSGRRTPQAADALFRVSEWALRQGRRELALYYINRLLAEHPLWPHRGQALSLKKAVVWKTITVEDGLGDNSVSSIRFDGDDVWVGTWLGGVTRFSRSQGRLQKFTAKNSGLVSDLIRDLWIDQSRVWAATFEGLAWFDKRTDKWQTVLTVAGLAGQRVKCVTVSDERLWVGTIGNGVSMLDFRDNTWKTWRTKDGLPDENIVTITPTPGSVWAGSLAGGIARYDLRRGVWQVWSAPLGSALKNVKSMAFDGQRLWIATHGDGLFSCDENGLNWRQFTRANSGLPVDFVHAVSVGPDGRVWAGTLEGGAAVYEPRTGAWRVYDIHDGLAGNDVISIAFEGRYVWFGTLNGGISVLLGDG